MSKAPGIERQQELAEALNEGGVRLAVAESCTGGLLGHLITSIPGSSRYFLGGVIAYANEVKTSLLGIRPSVLAAEGAVSEAVASGMAVGICDRLGASCGLGITGVAGPGGGSSEKPVGLVYIAMANNGGVRVERFVFKGDRDGVKTAAARAAWGMMIDEFLNV